MHKAKGEKMHKATTMVALVALLAAFALVLMASNNPAQANPSIVTVNANDSDGQPTGINVDAGDRVVIEATGLIDNNNTGGCNPDVPPTGIPNTPAGSGPPSSPLPSANVGALLWRIGTSGAWSLVGSGTSFTAPTSGQLYLIVNDTIYTDNCGSFKAEIDVDHPDTTPPRVSSTVPTKGATGLGPNANAKATFS